MNRILLILLIIPAYLFADQLSITTENTVILRTDYPYKTEWMPSEGQSKEALAKALAFIDHPSGVNDWQKSEIAKIKKNISSYKVQFVGIETESKKRIWCNFFCGSGFKDWKENVVLIKDGGFLYWQIQYDHETKTCINFRSNGNA